MPQRPQLFDAACPHAPDRLGAPPRAQDMDDHLYEMMKGGGYFYKHDFGRAKRGRKHLKLSTDGLKLSWKSVGANEEAIG